MQILGRDGRQAMLGSVGSGGIPIDLNLLQKSNDSGVGVPKGRKFPGFFAE